MRKSLFIVLMSVLVVTGLFASGTKENAVYPSGAVELVALGSAGGGSDVLARNITDVINIHNLVPEPVNVVNKAGGGGAVGIAYTNQKQDKDYALMTINSTHCLLMRTLEFV